MWNYKLKIKPKFSNECKDLIKRLNNIPDLKIIQQINKSEIEINITAKNIHKIKESVMTNIAFFIVNTYKNQFFYNVLKNQKMPQIHILCLCKALTIFDIENDIFLTLNELPSSGTLVVESFYVFKMAKIRAKWQEFANLSSLDSPMLSNSEIYVEFLKFLYNCIVPQIDEVHVYVKAKEFMLMDKNKKELMPKCDVLDELTLVTNLIFLAPKQVNLHCINSISNKTFKTLYYIFNKKINLV